MRIVLRGSEVSLHITKLLSRAGAKKKGHWSSLSRLLFVVSLALFSEAWCDLNLCNIASNQVGA